MDQSNVLHQLSTKLIQTTLSIAHHLLLEPTYNPFILSMSNITPNITILFWLFSYIFQSRRFRNLRAGLRPTSSICMRAVTRSVISATSAEFHCLGLWLSFLWRAWNDFDISSSRSPDIHLLIKTIGAAEMVQRRPLQMWLSIRRSASKFPRDCLLDDRFRKACPIGLAIESYSSRMKSWWEAGGR